MAVTEARGRPTYQAQRNARIINLVGGGLSFTQTAAVCRCSKGTVAGVWWREQQLRADLTSRGAVRQRKPRAESHVAAVMAL